MDIFIDTADLNVAKSIAEFFPVSGITTNPKILAGTKADLDTLFKDLRQFVDLNRLEIFVQTTGETAEEMLKQAIQCRDYFGENVVVKIPAIKEGYKAVEMCKHENIKVCVTVIHSMMQGLLAAIAGADYVAPYISHIDNIGADGVETVNEMIRAIRNGNYSCKVLGASFRTVDQIKRLAVVGCDAVTIAPELFDLLIAHSSTNESMIGFKNAWTDRFGSMQINDLLV